MKNSLLFLSTILFLVSCGKVREAANAAEGLKNYAEGLKESTSKIEERRAKGDTISIPYADLQKLLPANISGYTKDGDPKGESISMVGMSYSTASQVYKNGEAEITVNIMDYNASYAAFGAATAMFATGFSVDNAEEHLGAVDLGISGVKAWEDVKKKEKRSTIMAGVNDRFLVSVEGRNVDVDVVKEAVKAVGLEKLAGM
jgi:methionine synthase II (cobalamin-independent)